MMLENRAWISIRFFFPKYFLGGGGFNYQPSTYNHYSQFYTPGSIKYEIRATPEMINPMEPIKEYKHPMGYPAYSYPTLSKIYYKKSFFFKLID